MWIYTCMHLLYCILEGVQMVVSNESTYANVIVEAAGMMWQWRWWCLWYVTMVVVFIVNMLTSLTTCMYEWMYDCMYVCMRKSLVTSIKMVLFILLQVLSRMMWRWAIRRAFLLTTFTRLLTHLYHVESSHVVLLVVDSYRNR